MDDNLSLNDLMKKIDELEREYNLKIQELEEKIEIMENFLIHNTRGYYLRALKKL